MRKGKERLERKGKLKETEMRKRRGGKKMKENEDRKKRGRVKAVRGREEENGR